MKIVISGGSGFIGTNLTEYLNAKGNEVISLGSDYFKDTSGEKLRNALTGADVVINLAGVSINHRWSRTYKKKMYNSRVITTRKIVNILNGLQRKPELFISASAVGYYPNNGCNDEYSSVKGKGFLSDLCEAWEEEAKKVTSTIRRVITRFGVVLGKNGGAFPILRLPARFKVATVIGPGDQLLPWIYLGDLIKAMEHIIDNISLSGILNFVSPCQITNRDVMKAIGKRENSWLTITVPGFFIWLSLGQASTFITEGQCVIPKKLTDSGFSFEAPTVEKLLDKIYAID